MGSRAKIHPLICTECGIHFKGYRPLDKFCTSSCRWKWSGKQPDRKITKNAASLKWGRENFDRKRDYMLRYTYGISQEKYEELLALQGGGCAICNKTPAEEGKALAVDHDHKTGEIFGILCALCNKILIGRVREPTAFIRAAAYLKKGTGLFVPVRPKKRKKSAKPKPT